MKDSNKNSWQTYVSKVDWLITIVALVFLVWFIWALLIRGPSDPEKGVSFLDANVPECVAKSSPVPKRQKFHYNHTDLYFYQKGCFTISFYVIKDLTKLIDKAETDYKKVGFKVLPIPQLAILLRPDNKWNLYGESGYSRAIEIGTEPTALEYTMNLAYAAVIVDDNLPNISDSNKAALRDALASYFSKKKLPSNANEKTVQIYNLLIAGENDDYKEFMNYTNSVD